ncbi:hypothetical protein EDD76_1203 [Kineothrix alysoides]|uniref:Uncharacterized protein n=1 Tax=Kineothrix alysoides TaxID=1469948 RepID=A0A4R1QMC8_9FIRM|nr:hypothetical protein [Kineothrix alysoides]TCL54407.1 hypothetical protein EDD76_1203 [Kineothrix alysoides]
MTKEDKETYDEMTNEEYKKEIKIIQDKPLKSIDDNYLLRYRYICLMENEKYILE